MTKQTLAFIDVGKSGSNLDFSTSQIHVCNLMLFAKIKFSQKNLNAIGPDKALSFLSVKL